MIRAVMILSPDKIEVRQLQEAPVLLHILQFETSNDPEPKPMSLGAHTFQTGENETLLVYWPREWPRTLGMATLYTWMTRQKMDIMYSITELKRLLTMAKQLGFQDDIDYWSGLLMDQGVQV